MHGRTWRSGPLAVLVLTTALGALLATPGPARAQDPQLSATAEASIADATLDWGESTTLRGSGWAPGEVVEVILYAGGSVLARPTADGDGNISATIRAPSDVGSSTEYRLAVQGPGGDGLYGYLEVPLTIVGPTPVISVAKQELGWGETTTVSGDRYKSGAEITVSLFPDNTVLARTTAGAGDRFSVPIEIPSGLRSSRDYQLVVTGQGIDLLFHFDALSVTIIGDRPSIDVSADKVERGGSIDVDGFLFFKDTKAVITLLPGFEELASVTVRADGTFEATVQIPADAGGADPHQIVVTGLGADGLFAYVPADLLLGGDPGPGDRPARTTSSLAEGPDLGDRTTDTADVDPVPRAGDSGSGRTLSAVILLVLLLIALLFVVLSSRTDLRGWVRRKRQQVEERFRRD